MRVEVDVNIQLPSTVPKLCARLANMQMKDLLCVSSAPDSIFPPQILRASNLRKLYVRRELYRLSMLLSPVSLKDGAGCTRVERCCEAHTNTNRTFVFFISPPFLSFHSSNSLLSLLLP